MAYQGHNGWPRSCTDPENYVKGWGGGPEIFLVINIFYREFLDLPGEAIGPLVMGPKKRYCFSRGSSPVFLRKHIAICDFVGGPNLPPPLVGLPMKVTWI